LEQGLYHILAERAKEIAGKKKLETKSFVIELRIDATLERGEVRVQHSWEDSTSNKTGVLARPKNLPDVKTTAAIPTATATGKRTYDKPEHHSAAVGSSSADPVANGFRDGSARPGENPRYAARGRGTHRCRRR
jgi:hypothetical protein